MNTISFPVVRNPHPMRRWADPFDIQVPASIANLGPGCDTLAVAVQLYLRLRVQKLPGRGEVHFHFVDQQPPGENVIEQAYRSLAGADFDRLPSLSVEVRSEIPVRAGLGSRAAAVVAGLRLYEAVAARSLSSAALLNAACALELRSANVAASLLGGLAMSCRLGDGSVHAKSVSWPSSLGFLVLTPQAPLGEPRSEQSQSLSREDAVYNLQRVALLLHSLQSEDYSLLKHALNDRLHQPSRQAMAPCLAAVLEVEHPDLLGVCLSGAGPSMVALAERNHEEIARLLAAACDRCGIGHEMRVLRAHHRVEERAPLYRAGLLCC